MNIFSNVKGPKGKGERLITSLSGGFVLILTLLYMWVKVDLVPDGLGFIGYIDDIIVLIVMVVLGKRLYSSMARRIGRNKVAYHKLFQRDSFIQLMLRPGTWLRLVLIFVALSYVFWTHDLVPDGLGFIGLVDDAMIIWAAVSGLMKTMKKR